MRPTVVDLRRDLAAFAELFAEDGVHELPFAPPGIPRRLQGRDNIRAHLAAASETPLKHQRFEDVAIHETADPEVIIVEYDAVGEVITSGRPYRLSYPGDPGPRRSHRLLA
ncbi:nuclear transport factor 2 family protein [Actinopolymorpha alba]|uniref:nuclear transport factor 2 family protein n=1 Tax=Actinopolymorpha alba TaxID=533267 RepID=UPI0003A02073|nr:nuclear transport factor 2 family protein [Actinopolymorpha alba]